MHIDPDLPMLPGEVGPTAVAELETDTEAFERILFPPLAEEELAGWTRARLYARARELQLGGRSRMNKAQLRAAIIGHV